jgi:adenine-specific DNA-methyltransferase
MMFPRLFLARNLLADDGVIFLSIDDNEMVNLRKLCDDIFGEENFVESFVWKKSYGGGPKEKYAVTQHEYVLLYAKHKEALAEFNLRYDPEKVTRYYKHTDKNHEVRGPYRLKPLEATKSMDARPNLVYGIPAPGGHEVLPKRQWLWSKDRVLKALGKGELEYIKSKHGETFNYKQYLRDEEGVERGEKPFSVIDGIYTQAGTDDLRQLFNDRVVVQFPKPVDLIKKFIEIGCSGTKEAMVLDFFAGSSTTAHAVGELNKEAGWDVRYIMVQLPELCGEDSVAFKSGYKTIADIGMDRIRRANKVLEQSAEVPADELPGLKDEKSESDLGFKVFKLDRSNFQIWDGGIGEEPTKKDLEKQLELGVDHINPDSTPEDILYELLLKSGFELTTKVEAVEMEGKTVYSIEDDALLICLEDNLTKEVITEMARRQPARVVCLDQGFAGNDQLKTNAVQIMKSHEVEDFRTV